MFRDFGGGGVGVKADCLKKGPRSIGGMPSEGVFKGILACIFASFGENHGKRRTARSTSATVNFSRHFPCLPVLSSDSLGHRWGLIRHGDVTMEFDLNSCYKMIEF